MKKKVKEVLIVDDNSTNRYLLKNLLEEEGLEVTVAENGKEALERARANPPDLIVSDILMPVMDGYTLCRQCKSDEKIKQVPFIFYTATYTEPNDERFALSLGADRFIIKPQEPDSFINMIKETLDENHVVRQVAAKPLGEEIEFFRRHDEILFNKLEKKMLDLETANRRLRCLEEQYRLNFENVSDVVCTIDKDFIVQKMSPSVEKLLRYKPQDVIGRSFFDFGNLFLADSMERAIAEIRSILKGETISASVYSLVAKDGTVKVGEISGSPILRNDKIVGIASVIRDITERSQTEEKVRQSEKKYRELFDFLPIPVYEMTFEAKLISANRALYETFRGTEEDLINDPSAWQLLAPEDIDKSSRNIERLLKGEKIEGTEYNLQRLDGSVFPAIVISSLIYSDGKPVGLRGAIVDITERRQAEKQLRDTLESLHKAFGTTIQVMVSAVETRDPYTAGHQLRSADLARAIATEMGLPQDKLDGIRIAGSIHDIGKLSIPAEILSKPTRLTENEFSLIKTHSWNGHEILKNVASPWPLAEIIYQHHERMNGSGYPRNLKGNEILMEARILAVADVVESMASHRPYRPSLGIQAALDEIAKNRGMLYDPDVVDVCLKIFNEKGYKMAVR